ncbi:hypothetical protein GGR54DRAFT_265739 [Hypoxylon sp. NC1633]|nr:hypothetical protein GGR54DRAFT_265739 [Hypoxylon sp. NC1633]
MSTSLMSSMKKIAFLIFIISSVVSFASASSPPSASPSAETKLICHTNNQADCYPKVFSATDEFQIIHDDQDIPPGLHVQLDVQTGQRQAKLYNPKEENPALEGLPVDRSVVVIDPDTPQDDSPQIPFGAPAYEPVGAVKAPREKDAGFVQALETIKHHLTSGRSDGLAKALEDLEDLSHDMYYGLQIASDTEATQALFCLLTTRDATTAATSEVPLTSRPDFLASSILASSVRNNKPALRAVEQSWDAILAKRCTPTSTTSSTAPPPLDLGSQLYAGLEPASAPGTADEAAEAHIARIHLAVLDGLLKSPLIKAEFLARGGMRSLLRILLRRETVWDARRAKAARIVSDTFLDEEVGAVVGVWPTTHDVTEARICAEGGARALDDGCWEYHLEIISRDSRDAGWSRPLLDMLRRRRLGEEAARGRDEL